MHFNHSSEGECAHTSLTAQTGLLRVYSSYTYDKSSTITIFDTIITIAEAGQYNRVATIISLVYCTTIDSMVV